MTNNQLAENSVIQLLNSVKLARDNAERADNRVDHSFYYALTIALEELQERRKAAMDSEPVAYMYDGEDGTEYNGHNEFSGGGKGIPLYRHAQPAPVVPDDVLNRLEHEANHITAWHHMDEHSCKVNRRDLLTLVNSCRSAMLAAAPQSPGSEPATVPGKWIPVSERLPEDSGRYWCYVEEQNDLGKSHYQWNCSWNGDRWWVESEGGGIVTHWMPLPAAPKEVKGE